jgi:hypothetical protein
VRKFFAKYRKSRNLDIVIQESQANSAQKSTDDMKQSSTIEVMEVGMILCDFLINLKFNQFNFLV